ncbi:MAG: hypothetical protein MJZ64_05735 [Paludibacteraceae bacterium]|nr:hypothetical protein [Paludibacteraceae bacterium]
MERERVEILKYLLENHVLAPSASALSKEIKREDKHLFTDRLDTAKDSTILRAWNAIKSAYNISDYTLTHLPLFWDLSSRMAEQLTQDDFVNLCNRRYSKIKDAAVKAQLRDIEKESVLDYCCVLALFIAKVSRHNPNECKNSSALIEVLQLVDGILQQHFPEGLGGHSIAIDFLSQAKNKKMLGWSAVFTMVGRVICFYTNPLILDQMMEEDFAPLSIEDDSWWADTDADNETTTLWHLSAIAEDSGIYNVWQWTIQRALVPTRQDCKAQRWGFFRNYATMRCVELENNKIVRWNYYDFSLQQTQETTTLELIINDTLGDTRGVILPQTLQPVKKDSIWGQWIGKQDRQQIDQIETEAFLQAFGVEGTDMEVVDVTMSRDLCILHIKCGNNGLRMAHLKIDKYPNLHSISVWDSVDILRGADGNLYAWWEKPNIRICLPKEAL